MHRLRLASRLWLAILPIALAALLAGSFVAWSFLQEAESHEQAAQSARVADAAVDALRGVWVEAEGVDATTWGVDVDTSAARDIADAAIDALDRAATDLVASASSDGQTVAESIQSTVGDARSALAEVRSRAVTETDPDRYEPVTSLILTIVPKTSFFIEDRIQARELIATADLAEAARVTFGEEQIAAARPVLNFVTEVESEGDELFDDASMAMLSAAEEEFADWLTRAGAASPTAARRITLTGISGAPMVSGVVDPDQIPVDRFEQVLSVAEALATRVADASIADAGAARTQAYVLIAATALVLLIAGWEAFATSRTVVRRVRTVTEAARQIANVDLPNMVDALRNPQQQFDAPSVVIPLEASHPDEVGELARSFGALHTTLIEVASQQMEILRKGVSEIFVTLARRNQALVDRQLALIDQLESSEEDPEILGGYYKLDHLATRMRRNAESLLVLAGTDSPRVWGRPLAMSDVVRAALGEVDDYQRVDVLALEPARVSGGVVTDLAHLISELLDNAAQFSPPTERVRVTGLFERAGYLLTISDGGIGMSDGRLAELNRMLESPPVLGLALEPTLGMYVVARLAARHDVSVELVSGVPGTTARITIPRSLLEAGEGRPRGSVEETPAREALPHTLRTVPAQEPVPALNGASSAPYAFRAVVGSDDSADQPSEVGRSEETPHPLTAHAPAPTDSVDEATQIPEPTVPAPAAKATNVTPGSISQIDATDRPMLPTRQRRTHEAQPAPAEPAPALETVKPSPSEATEPEPALEASDPSPSEATEPEPATGTARPETKPAEDAATATDTGHPTSVEPLEDEPAAYREVPADANPPGGRRRAGQHRAAGRTERAPWDRSAGPEPHDDSVPGTSREDTSKPRPSVPTDVAVPAAATTPGAGADRGRAAPKAGGPSHRSDSDWWGPKENTVEPAAANAADDSKPDPGRDASTDQTSTLPLRSPGVTFREASASGDSSSPSRFGASGIRAALTAYRTGRDSVDDGTPENGDDE